MRITLPDLGPDFSAQPVNAGNEHRPQVQAGTFDVRPGAYVLTAAGAAHPDWTPETVIGRRRLGAFVAPPSSEAPTAVVHAPPAEVYAGEPFTVFADVVSQVPVDSVALFVRKVGEWRRTLRLPMEPAGAFVYQVQVPAERTREGLVEYAVSVYENGQVRTFPGDDLGDPYRWDFTGREYWQAQVVAAGTPLLLFDGRRDLEHVLYPHPWEYVRFQIDIVSGSEPDRLALSAVVQDFTPSPHHFALRTFLPEGQRTRLGEAASDGVLRIRARAAERASDRMEVALVERDGTAWATVVELKDAWQEFAIPVSELRPTPLALLPRPFPQFLPYLWESTSTREGPQLAELDGLQFSVGADLFQGDELEGAHGFEIERVVLDHKP
jgi:hypothetical protein